MAKKKSNILLIIAGVVVLAAALAAALILARPGEIKGMKMFSVPLENAAVLEVGGLCHFIGDEKQSIPYRWKYYISDESVIGVFADEYEDRSGLNVKPGGDQGLRKLYFEALAPGECVITLHYEDIRDGTYSEKYTYTVVITGGGAATQPTLTNQ